MEEVTIRERMLAALHAAEISQRSLANAISVSPAAVSLWMTPDPEKRVMPTRDNIIKMAKVLGVPYNWLAYGEITPGDDPDNYPQISDVDDMANLMSGARRSRLKEFMSAVKRTINEQNRQLAQNFYRTIDIIATHQLDLFEPGKAPRRTLTYASPATLVWATPTPPSSASSSLQHFREGIIALNLIQSQPDYRNAKKIMAVIDPERDYSETEQQGLYAIEIESKIFDIEAVAPCSPVALAVAILKAEFHISMAALQDR